MRILLLLLIIALIVYYYRFTRRPGRAGADAGLPAGNAAALLEEHVAFYRGLQDAEKKSFLGRVQHFLDTTRLTPVDGATVTDADRIYVAASAIIPIFHFDGWAYNNLDEVLLYPGTFTKEFSTEEEERNVLGMVGDGAMHRMMILSLPALRAGFEQKGAGNTGIHEFVHLIDKADGATDGLPEYLIPKSLVRPWLRAMHRAMNTIRSGDSDINPYAGTNEAEFLAVLSEYFFQKPAFLKEHHPDLYALLDTMYRR